MCAENYKFSGLLKKHDLKIFSYPGRYDPSPMNTDDWQENLHTEMQTKLIFLLNLCISCDVNKSIL